MGMDLNILLIDDNAEFARAISLLLRRRLSARVDVAYDLASARRQIRERTYDLVALDYQLPDGTGFELVEDLKKELPGAPFIVVTGGAEGDLRQCAADLGAEAFIRKDEKVREKFLEFVRRRLAIGPA